MLISCLVPYIRFNIYKGKTFSYWKTTSVFSFPSLLSYPLVFTFPLISFSLLFCAFSFFAVTFPQPFAHYTMRISGTPFHIPWLTSTRNLWCLYAKKDYRHKHILTLNWVFAHFIFRKLILVTWIRKWNFQTTQKTLKPENWILEFEHSTRPSQRCTAIAISRIIISSFWRAC